MATSAGPDITTDNLVFGYDTGYPSATNVQSLRFNKGEPVVNYTDDTPNQGGWTGTYNVIDSARKTFRFNVSNFNGSAGSGQGWRSFTWNLNGYSGAVTISATIEVPADSPGTFAWIMMGQTNTNTNNVSGAGQYLGYSAGSERVQKTTTTKEHITWSGTLGSTGTASQPSGHVGFTLWYNGGTSGTNHYVEVSDVQIELKSHETPFVNGTRSSTQSLIDLKETTDIDVDDVSFDSNAQLSFDGTDDKIVIPADSYSNIGTDDFTVEVVFKNTKTSNYNHFFSVKDQYHFALKMQNTSNRNIYVYRSSALSTFEDITANAPSTTDYYHLVCKREGDNLELYLNGVSKGTKSGWGSIEINNDEFATSIGTHGTTSEFTGGEIPIVKLYNKSLTSAEIKSNFNAIKNRFGI